MIGRKIKISKEDRKRIVNYLETTPATSVKENLLDKIELPSQMKKIIILRFLQRNKIKDIETKLGLTQDVISDRTTQALNLILKYLEINNIKI